MSLERPDLLLFANVTFVWIIANYLPLGEMDAPARRRGRVQIIRIAAVLIATGFVAGWRDGWFLALTMAGAATLLLVARERIAKVYLAELELLNVAVLASALGIIRARSLVTHAWFEIDCKPNVAPALLLIGGVICYTLRGGNHIVRGLLEKGALIPTAVSTVNLRVQHGRLIGYLERIIVIAAVAAGSFEALAFLMAAKGLIRAKELEDRPFAEYFLVGSLCSALVALLAGMLISSIAKTVPNDAWITVLV